MAVARNETECVDTLRYSWHNLQQQVRDTSARLAELELHFRRQLIDDVTAFTNECSHFCIDYETVGHYDSDCDCCYVYTVDHVTYHIAQCILFITSGCVSQNCDAICAPRACVYRTGAHSCRLNSVLRSVMVECTQCISGTPLRLSPGYLENCAFSLLCCIKRNMQRGKRVTVALVLCE